jgi:hypothetical protein
VEDGQGDSGENIRIDSAIRFGFTLCDFWCNAFVAFLPAPPLQGLAGQFLYTLSVSHY